MKSNELKAARVRVGLSQSNISEIMGISNLTYRKKENGSIEFKRNEIEQLVKILNLEPEEMLHIFFS